MFGHMRTLTHNRNFNLAEANLNLSTAHQISHILEEHPEWSRGHRRLKATEDKVNPLSWQGNMKVTRHMDIPALYNQGMQQAKAAILASGLLVENSPDLDFYNLATKGFSLRCPHGEWVGVTLMYDEEESDCDEEMENGDEALEVGQHAHEEAQLEAQAFDDAAVTMEDACTEAAAFIKHPNTTTILKASRCTSPLPFDLEYHQIPNLWTALGELQEQADSLEGMWIWKTGILK